LFRHSSFPGSIREIDVFKQALIAEAGNESALVQSFLSSARELVEGKLATVHKRADCYNWASSLVVFADWMGTDWLMKKYVFPSSLHEPTWIPPHTHLNRLD